MVPKMSCRKHVAPAGPSAGRGSARRAWLALFAGVVLLAARPGVAQNAAEIRAFDAAARAFQDAIYDRAEKEFGEFVRSFPESARVSEAVLFQARSALKQTNLKVTVELLTANLAKAGPPADQYHSGWRRRMRKGRTTRRRRVRSAG